MEADHKIANTNPSGKVAEVMLFLSDKANRDKKATEIALVCRVSLSLVGKTRAMMFGKRKRVNETSSFTGYKVNTELARSRAERKRFIGMYRKFDRALRRATAKKTVWRAMDNLCVLIEKHILQEDKV